MYFLHRDVLKPGIKMFCNWKSHLKKEMYAVYTLRPSSNKHRWWKSLGTARFHSGSEGCDGMMKRLLMRLDASTFLISICD